MEGDRILKELLKKKLDGLYVDTKNYLGSLRSLVEDKNGFTATGCNTAEDMVSKYGAFCNKFLRCGIEVLRNLKEADKEFDELLKLLDMVAKILNMVITLENGKYLASMPSIEDISKKLVLLANHLLSKDRFIDALNYSKSCLNYLELAIDQKINVELVKSLGSRLAYIVWRGAQVQEQQNSKKYSKGSKEQLSSCCTILEWRLCALKAEAIADVATNNLVTKAFKIATKFQMEFGAENTESSSELLSFYEDLFTIVTKRKTTELLDDGQHGINSFFSLIELGFHYGRTCLIVGKLDKGHNVFEQLQSYVSHTLTPKSVNTASGSTVSRFCTCICSIGNAALLMESIIMNRRTIKKSQPAKEFLVVNKLLDEIRRLLNLLIENRTKATFPISTISLSLESFKSRILIKQNNKKGVCQSRLALSLPYQTFQSLEPLFHQYGILLKLQAQSITRNMQSEKKTEEACKRSSQLKQQLQRTAERQLSLSSFTMLLYQSMMKQGSDDVNTHRVKLLAQFQQRAKQSSELIHSLMINDDVMTVPDSELLWHGTVAFSLGADAYSMDLFKEGGALMMVGCQDLKDWCLSAGSDRTLLRQRLQEIQPKYRLLSDCMRRAKCLKEALASNTTGLMISLALTEEPCNKPEDFHEVVFDWIKTKHQIVKYSANDDAQEIRARTLCNAMAEEEGILEVTSSLLALVLQEELVCYKSLGNRYDMSTEQLSVIKQLMALYEGDDKSLELASIILEYAQILHTTTNLSEDKSPLDLCQEAVDILESLSEQNSADKPSMVAIHDKLGSGYLWQGILKHHAVIGAPTIANDVEIEGDLLGDTKVAMDDSEMLGEQEQLTSLDQPFIHSLHAAVDSWTAMIELIAKHSPNEMDVTALSNPLETVQNLRRAALLYGLLNQPLNQVHALHLCSVIARSIGTQDALDDAIVSYALAIHTLCSIQDLYHVNKLIGCIDNMVDTGSPSPRARIHHLLAKSQYCLLVGKFSEGDQHLQSVLTSDLLAKKTGTSFLLLARAKSIMAEYMSVPTDVYSFQPYAGSSNPCDPLTPLEAASDSYSSVEGAMAASFGHTLSDFTSTTSESRIVGKGRVDDDLRLVTLQSLLQSLLQLGTMLAHQGMVKQAIKYLTDGLTLAKRFHLPFRSLEFVTSLSVIKLQMGQTTSTKRLLRLVACQLAPVLHTNCGTPDDLEDFASIPPVVNHPVACHCMCCSDPALQVIQIKFFLAMARYFQSISLPKLSIRSLEGTEALCSNAVSRARGSLDELSSTLQLGMKAKDNVEETVSKQAKVKGKGGKARKGKKASKDALAVAPSSEVTSQAMFGLHFAELFALNSELLLHSGKLKKALDVVVAGLDTVSDIRKALGGVPSSLTHVHAKLYYLQGVVYLLKSNGGDMDVWGLLPNGDGDACEKRVGHPVAALGSRALLDGPADDAQEGTATKKPRKGRGRSAKVATSKVDNAGGDVGEAPTRRRGRGRGKKEDKVDEVSMDGHHPLDKKEHGKIATPKDDGLHQAIESFNKALGICQSWPEPILYSGICRCLTLCHGRANPRNASHYLNQSLAVTLRHEAMNSSRKKLRKLVKDHGLDKQPSQHDIDDLANDLKLVSLEDEPKPPSLPTYSRLRHMRQVMKFESQVRQDHPESSFPPEWTVCTVQTVALPTGSRQLLLSRLRHGTEPVILKLPIPTDNDSVQSDEDNCCEAVSKAVMDLSKLFQGSVEEGFTDVMRDSTDSMTISSTKEWCDRRSSLDNTLGNLLVRLETSWLGKWRGVVLGRHAKAELEDSLRQCAEDLSQRITTHAGRTVDTQMIEILLDSHHKLTSQEVKDALVFLTGLPPMSSGLKEVFDEFMNVASELQPEGNKASRKKKACSAARDRHPVILILGKDIQHLAWESIPILRNHPVTRMPSLQFVLAHAQLVNHGSLSVDPQRTYYVLNPDNNLPNTQKIFQKWFEGESSWQGVTGTKPSQDQYRSALVEHDLFLYLGHGNGRSFLNGYDVQRLNCRATSLLMGCSSGKLIVEGDCEPRGMSLNYLLAGCPAILANLWDVTDRDIDRFTVALLQTWLQNGGGEHKSLAQVLCQARNACKLPYLIGAAPVIYGIPVYLKQ